MPIEIQTHDSPLGRWTMTGSKPAHLAGIVDALWYFEGFVVLPRERVFPDGRVDLIVHLGPRYAQVDGERVERFSTVCISGLLLRSNLIEAPPGECAVLGIRLYPAGAYALLGRPLPNLAGITALAPDPAVAWTAAEIERQGGAVSIAALRERTGWSKSRLTERFKEQVGVPPKVLARIVRFRRTLARLHALDPEESLADLACSSGYYDQPHLNAEFREIAGFSPGDYRARSHYAESVSLAEPGG